MTRAMQTVRIMQRTMKGTGGVPPNARLTAALGALMLAVFLLGGCLYPRGETPGRETGVRDAVLVVQNAVDRYLEANGVLPIFNADESVPEYEKFRIDFGKLKRGGWIGDVPAVSFEGGGPYVFLIVGEETEPTVRLLDLRVREQIVKVERRVKLHLEQGGELPAGEEVYPGFRALDFGRLGMRDPGVRSVFSGQILPLLVDARGRVYADYALDVAEAVRRSGGTPSPDEDARRLLVEQSYYVPVKSPAYRWRDGEPVAVMP